MAIAAKITGRHMAKRVHLQEFTVAYSTKIPRKLCGKPLNQLRQTL